MRNDDDDEPELDAAERAVVHRLRALPREGQEPDWAALERSIRDAVGPDMPKPWFKSWRWLVPIGALAAATAAALLWVHRPASAPESGITPLAATTAAPQVEPEVPTAPEPAMAMWLDGNVIDLDGIDPSAILDDDDDRRAESALATDDGATAGGEGGILPAGELGWIDALDETALDRAEQWLEKRKKG
jgi:hypothetical protein